MKAYLDSGIFVDYFVHHGYLPAEFRSASRRGRSPVRLGEDATLCLKTIARHSLAITSSFTPYEMEEAAYRVLRLPVRGTAHRDRSIVPTARAVAAQTLNAVKLFAIELLDLTPAIMRDVTANEVLQSRGIRAADAIHVTSALHADADLLITADRSMLALDRFFPSLRCVDTDEALRLLA